jgi:hypothetical protein
MKKLLLPFVILFISNNLILSQRRAEIINEQLSSANGNFSIFTQGTNFVIHTTSKNTQNSISQNFTLIDVAHITQKAFTIEPINQKKPILFSASFTRRGFGVFELVENKKNKQIEIHFHEVQFKEMKVSNKLVHNVSGDNTEDFLVFFDRNPESMKSVLYVLFKGNGSKKAYASVVSLDYEMKSTHVQEINFQGMIDGSFENYMALSHSGYVVSFHKINDKKNTSSNVISVLNTNSRTQDVSVFVVSSGGDEELTSHKIYVEKDMIHLIGTIHKNNNDEEASLFQNVYGIVRNAELSSTTTPIKLPRNVKSHTLLTISKDNIVYIVEEGYLGLSSSGTQVLGKNKSTNPYSIDPLDDEETRLRKETELRSLLENETIENSKATFTHKSQNLLHVFSVSVNGRLIWTDIIRRYFDSSPVEYLKMEDAMFDFYIWGINERVIFMYNDLAKGTNATAVGTSNSQVEKKPIQPMLREYTINGSRFIEKPLEFSEKSSLQNKVLVGTSRMSQTQMMMTIIKNDKGQYFPCKMTF